MKTFVIEACVVLVVLGIIAVTVYVFSVPASRSYTPTPDVAQAANAAENQAELAKMCHKMAADAMTGNGPRFNYNDPAWHGACAKVKLDDDLKFDKAAVQLCMRDFKPGPARRACYIKYGVNE
jgi:hypothetical protein